MSLFGAFSHTGNSKHYIPDQIAFNDYALGGAAEILYPDGQASFESAQVPGNYDVVRDPHPSTRFKQNAALRGAQRSVINSTQRLDAGGDLTRAGLFHGQLEPGETYLEELYDEIDIDSKVNKTGLMSDAVDLIQGSMYGISGGVLELMRTGEIDQGFKQFLSEIRHSWDDDYTPDPDSWFNRPVYNAEWGQILRSNDGIIGKKLLDAIDTNPFLAFMDAKTIDDLTDISAIDHIKDLGELWNVVSDNEYRQGEVDRIRRETGVMNVSLTDAENNSLFWLGLGLDIALDPLTYMGIGWIGRAGKIATGKEAILRGLETGEEVTKRVERAYNTRLREDPQGDVAIRRANLKEELQSKIGDVDPETNKPLIESDIEERLLRFDEGERALMEQELTPQRTRLGKISDAVPIDLLTLRDEGYLGKGGAVATGIDNFTNLALGTIGRASNIHVKGFDSGLGGLFITNNVVKRLKNPHVAKNLASFLQENAEEITGRSKADIDKDELLNHLTGDVDVLTDNITQRSEDYLQLVKDASLDRASETQAIKNGMLLLSKRYGLDARYAMSLFAAKPDIAKRLIDEGDYTDPVKDQMREVLRIAQDLMEEIKQKDQHAGLLDETQLRADYVPSRAPLSRSGQRTMEAFLKDNVDGDEAEAILRRIEAKTGKESFQVALDGDVKATFQNRAVFQDLYGKLLALSPSEMDFSLLYGNRAFESLRLRNTRKFQDHILNDRMITIPVASAIAKDAANPMHKKLKQKGYDFYSPAGNWKDEGEVFYAMPSDMVKALETTNTLFKEATSGVPTLLRSFGKVWKEGTAMWRQWALGTFGYVSRNVQSNFFTNYVAGVTSPHRYLESALLQWGSTENMPRGLREYAEFKIGGPKAVENYKFKLRDGRVLSLRDMREEMDRQGLLADSFSTNEMVELAGIESATFGIYDKGRVIPSGVISAGIKGMPSWGVTEDRVNNATRHIQEMYRDAGNTDVGADEARAIAEVYDGMARQWAWHNGRVPSEWWDEVTIKGFSGYDQVKTKFVEDTLLQVDPSAAKIDEGFDPWWVGNQAEAVPALRSLIARKVEANAKLGSKENIWRKDEMGDLVLTFEELQKSFASKIIKKKGREAARVKKEMGKLNLDSSRNTFIGIEDWLDLNAKENPTGEITKSSFVDALNRGLFRVERRGLTPEEEALSQGVDRVGSIIATGAQDAQIARYRVSDRIDENNDKLLVVHELKSDLFDSNKTDWQAPAMKLLIQEASRGGYSKIIWEGDYDAVANRILKDVDADVGVGSYKLSQDFGAEGPATMTPTTFDVSKIVPELVNEDGTLIPLYHGTDQVVKASRDQFGNLKPPPAKGPRAGQGGFKKFRKHARGTWVTTDPKNASAHGMSAGNRAMDRIGVGEGSEAEKVFGKPAKVLEEEGVIEKAWAGRYSWENPTAGRVVPLYADIKKVWRIPENMKDDFYASGDPSSSFPSQAAAEKWAIEQARRAGADAVDHGGGTYQIVDPEILESALSPSKKGGNYKSIDISDDLSNKALNGGDFTLYQKDANTDKVKGLVSFLDDGRRLVASFREGDVSTMVHELAHIARRSKLLTAGDMNVINNWIFGMDTAKGKSLINKRIDEYRKEWLGDETEMEWSDEDRLRFVDEYMWTDPQPLPGEKLNAEEKFAKAVEQYVLEGGLKPAGLSSNHISALERLQKSMRVVYGANLDQINKLFPEEMPIEVKQNINKILGQQVEGAPEEANIFKFMVEAGEAEEARRGSIGGRAVNALLGTEDEYPLSREGLKKALGNNAWLRFVRGAARITEHNARGALFIQSMVDGMSGKDAAQNVKKYLFDYSELTDFEKNVMRNVIPFYSWIRKNIPLQLQSVLERPAKYANVAKVYSELGDMSLQTHGDDPPTPDYFRETLNVRLPSNLGNQPTYIMPDLPYLDFETAEGFLDVDKWIGMSHPVIKMGLEQLGNKKSLTGAPISKEQGADEPLLIGDINVDEIMGPRLSYALEGMLPPVSRAKSTLRDYGRGKTGVEMWARSLGINLRSVDVDRVLAQRTYYLRNKTNAEVQKVEKELNARQKRYVRLMGFGDGQ